MLVIRLQRVGRSGHAMLRVVVQDSRKSSKSGRVVSLLGSYDPHAKKVTLKKDEAQKFLDNGAQPSNRVINLLKNEGVKMPAWVEKTLNKERAVRNPEKRRSTTPKVEEPAVEEVAAPVEAPTEEKVAETPAVAEEAKEEVSTEA